MTLSGILRASLAPGALTLALAATPAMAQMYPGGDVTVNPGAVGGPVARPGGLLPPGVTSRDLAPVHLHMPKKHHRRRVATHKPKHVARSESESSTRTAASEPAPAQTEADTSSTENSASAIPFSFGTGEAPKAAAPAKPARKKLANIAPMPKVAVSKGLSKQGAILFDSGSSELSDNSSSRLNDLAFSLKTALANGADHVELIAYGGSPGDKSSTSRRLSLKRALAVREALIVDGVPSNRIDVRALGGVTDNGPTDRVDIFVKG